MGRSRRRRSGKPTPLGSFITGATAPVAALALGWVLGNLARRQVPTHRSVVPPAFTVVVPARNEAHRIGRLLERLDRQVPVIVVDDQSTDATAEVCERLGATVVSGLAPPPGWSGKPWALHVGVSRATTELVVCIDADVEVDAASVRWLATHLAGSDLVSAAPRFEIPPRARWLHAAMLTTLIYRTGRPGTTPPPHRSIINGQIFAARRQDLLRWMPAVGNELVEDIALARLVPADGGVVRFLDGGERFTVRAYESVAQVWSGWGRSIGFRGVDRPWRATAEVAAVGASMAAVLLRHPVGAVAVGVRFGTLVGARTAYVERGWSYWLSPLADPLALTATLWGLVNPRVEWKQRRWSRNEYR